MSTLLNRPGASSSTLSRSPLSVGPSGDAFHRPHVQEALRKLDYAWGYAPPSDRRVLGERGMARLNQLLQLPQGWDGHRAKPVTERAAIAAMGVLFAVANDRSLSPQVVPLPDGGIQLEWHAGGYSIEIEVNGSGGRHYLATRPDGDVVVDEEGDASRVADLPGLTAALLERLSGLVRSVS